jgi:hypothetical protein
MPKPARYKQPKPDRDTLELCAEAGEMIKRAGFVRLVTSMKTEAVYYRWPDRNDVIRVASHKGNAFGLNRIAARITFGNDRNESRPRTLRISDEKFEAIIAAGIGRYFLNC